MSVGMDHKGRWLDSPLPGGWVEELLNGAAPKPVAAGSDGIICARRRHGRFQCITVRLNDAASLDPLNFQRAVLDAYRVLRGALDEGPRHPVRFWNFIPDIGRPIDEALSQYMVFNAGRHCAYMNWHGHGDADRWRIATASGVGHRGRDLVIHCLACDTPGRSIENPRQIPAFRYSRQYGPFPPTFSRATVLPGSPQTNELDRVLVGGTASIRGEHSHHMSSLRNQTRETLVNLATVIRRASLNSAGGSPSSVQSEEEVDKWLSLLRFVRIYYLNRRHRSAIESLTADRLDCADEIEWMEADLCRPELLVEIEAVAELKPLTTSRSTRLLSVERCGAAAEA